MRIIARLTASFLLSFAIVLTISSTVLAATPYLASNQIGQSSFTTKLTNNIVTPNNSGLRSPDSIALDPLTHQLFISDKSNHRVLVHTLDSSNNLIDRNADFVIGQTDFNTRATALTQSGLNNPRGIALDTTNKHLFVADSANNRVMVFDYTSITNGENAVNVIGQPDFTTGTSAITQSKFNNPQGLLYNSGILYVGDTNNARLLFFDVSTISDGENAINVLGDTNFTGATTGSNASTLFSPTGLAIDTTGNRLFVSDTGVDRVLVFDISTLTNGEPAINVFGNSSLTTATGGTPVSSASSLDDPRGLSYDPVNDLLYVADRTHSRVVIYDSAAITNGEDAVHVLGQQDFTSYSKQADDAELSYPTGLLLDDGTLYVVTELDDRTLLFDVDTINDGESAFDILGQTDANGGPRYNAFLPNNVYPSNNSQFSPTGVKLDTNNHRLFVADWGNNRILVHQLDANNQFIDNIADQVIGQPSFVTDAGGLTQNSLLSPQSIAYDAARNWLYVADSNNSRVLVFDVTTISNGENAIHVLGQADFTSQDTTMDQSSLDSPNSVAYDEARRLLFVTDASINRILVFDVATISNGENSVNVIGQPDFTTGYTEGPSANQINYPYNIIFDPSTNWLFVSDSFNDRVSIFDTTTISNGMSSSFVLGSSDINSAGSALATQSSTYIPTGLAIDQDNRLLFVTDFNDRVMIFDINSITNGENAIGLLGRSDFTDSSPTTVSQSTIDDWGEMIFDDINNSLFIADASSNRVLTHRFAKLTTSALPAGNSGSPYSATISNANTQGTVSYGLSSGVLPAGLSLTSGGVISGTTSQVGVFTVEVEVSDNNGVAGIFKDRKSYTLTINADVDSDGVEDAIEDSAPNGGDANDDGLQDSTQNEVSSNVNSVTDGYTTVQTTSGSITNYSILDEANLPTQNNTLDFPVGLNSFSVEGITPGSSTTVTVFYDRLYDTGLWTFMKYNTKNNTYTNMNGAVTYSTANVGGTTVTTATYTLTDGGEFDEDGIANGTIVDPAGPAVLGILANTGSSAYDYIFLGIFLLIATACVSSIPRRMSTKEKTEN